jgi:ABC-type transport system involved in cytochrome c biogenesis permease subunit
MNFVPLAFYSASLIAYAWHFARRNPIVGKTATTMLVAGALAHTFVIGMQTMEAGHVPITDSTTATSTFVWLLALAYLYMEMTTEDRAMGVLILPLLIGLQAIPALHPGVEQRSAVLQGPLFGILLFKEIKAKHLGFFYARLPSLQALDRMNHWTIMIGWISLTIGIAAGAMFAAEARALPSAALDPRVQASVQAMSLGDPKIFVALVCWLVYSFEAFAARRIGWGGRRTAYLSALGFSIVLLNFVPISYFVTTSHDF